MKRLASFLLCLLAVGLIALVEVQAMNNGDTISYCDYICNLKITTKHESAESPAAKETCLLLAEGYITLADTTFHAYIPDYQGNIIAVYNTRTDEIEQQTDYYPYGLPHADTEASTPQSNRRKYGAKELMTDHGLNLYDFEARHQNPAFPTFTTVDDLAEEKFYKTCYSFCNNDCINFIDPYGLDEFSLDKFGNLNLLKKTRNYDRIIFLDNNGKVLKNNNGEDMIVTMPYGTILGVSNPKWIDDNDENHYMTVVYVSNGYYAKVIFETVCAEETTDVEWSITFSKFKGRKLYAVGNSHDVSRTYQASFLLSKGCWIYYDAHYHPNGSQYSKSDQIVCLDIKTINKRAIVEFYSNGVYEEVPLPEE